MIMIATITTSVSYTHTGGKVHLSNLKSEHGVFRLKVRNKIL